MTQLVLQFIPSIKTKTRKSTLNQVTSTQVHLRIIRKWASILSKSYLRSSSKLNTRIWQIYQSYQDSADAKNTSGILIVSCLKLQKLSDPEIIPLKLALDFFESQQDQSVNNYIPEPKVIRKYQNTYEVQTGDIQPQNIMEQPQIISHQWGSILIEWETGKISAKDAIVLPERAFEWDWVGNQNDIMHHQPGIRVKDLDHFLDYDQLQGGTVILSKGRKLVLKVDDKVILNLKQKGIENVYVLETKQAIDKYEELRTTGIKIAAFIHTTC